MQNQNKDKKIYNKKILIKKIAKMTGREIRTVRTVYNAMEEVITELLASADVDTDITIRLFEGFTIDSTFIPEQIQTNNLTGKVITALSKIRLKANITRNYRNKVTAYNK